MVLAYKIFGDESAPPVVVLHGLLGAARNWTAAAKELAVHYRVIAMDLRNHGDSPHTPEMSFTAMAGDVAETLDALSVGPCVLMGHSLGGKVAMRFVMDYPERVRALVVVDIAPKVYQPLHTRDFEAMLALPLEDIKSRKEADALMAETVPELGHRQFLLTNLIRGEGNTFSWGINLSVLYREMDTLRAMPLAEDETWAGPAVFALGGKSRFVKSEDHATILKHFPKAKIEVSPDAGHNLHMEAREAFVAVVTEFCNTFPLQS